MDMDWKAIAIALSVGIVGILGVVFTGLKELIVEMFKHVKQYFKRKQYTVGLKQLAQFHNYLERLRYSPFVERVIVFSGKNGGGIPTPGRPYTIESVYGWSQKDNTNPQELYDFKLPIDGMHLKILTEMLEKGNVKIIGAELPPGSQFQRYFIKEGLHTVLNIHLKINEEENEMVYLSVGSYSKDFTDEEVNQILTSVDKLKSILA